MDGPMPDPSTLSDASADDDVPLNVVREKATMERAGSLRNGSSSTGNVPQPPRRQQVDLFGDMEEAAPARPSTTEPAIRAAPAKAPAAPPKQTRAGESLLGMDFFGSTQSAPPRPSSATSGMTAPASTGRADLKNSILSLYASAPKPAAPAPQTQHRQQPSASNVDFFGGMQSPTAQAQPAVRNDPFASMSSAGPAQSKPQSSNLDLFGSMQSPPLTSPVQQQANYSNFGGMQSPPLTTSAPKPQAAAPKPQINSSFFGGMQSPPLPKASSFSSLASPAGPAKSSLSGGGFFDPKPAPPPKDFSPPRKQPMSPITTAPAPTQTKNNTFGMDSLSISGANSNPWGNDNAWAQPDPAPAPAPAPPKPQPVQAPQPVQDDDFGGWNHASPVQTHATPAVPQQQEEFGGWSHASPVSERAPPAPAAAPKQNFGGGQDDLFGNVWS
jgi:stromal membrane-associated protein